MTTEVLPAISLMSAQHVQEFGGYVAEKHANLLGQIHESFEVRSLRELCRNSLYDSVSFRRMAAAVPSLPLPKQLKEFLLLGMKIEDL